MMIKLERAVEPAVVHEERSIYNSDYAQPYYNETLYYPSHVRSVILESPLALNLVYTQQPLYYRSQYEVVRIAGLMSLSTGNIFQAYLIRLAYPDLSGRSVLTQEMFEEMNQNYQVRYAAQEFLRALREIEHSDELDIRSALRDLLRNFYAVAASPGPPPPPPPGSEDDLAKKIARELAKIYYENLDLTIEDIQTVIKKYFKTDEAIQAITDDFIDKIVHAKIDQDRMELRALLPDENIIKVAIDALRQPQSFLQVVQDWIKRAWNFIASWFGGGGGGGGNGNENENGQNSQLYRYKVAITKTIDKYISWWKMSWFGHHHDGRARAVKEAIQFSGSTQEIQNILERQKYMVVPGNENNRNLPSTIWNDQRWNSPDTVKNKYPVNQSGYFKVVSEALEIDPFNPQSKP